MSVIVLFHLFGDAKAQNVFKRESSQILDPRWFHSIALNKHADVTFFLNFIFFCATNIVSVFSK